MNLDLTKTLTAATGKLLSSIDVAKYKHIVLGFIFELRGVVVDSVGRIVSWCRTPWSLQSVVRRDEAEWYAFNRYRKKFALSRLDKELLFGSEHPVRFSVSLLGLLLAALALGHVLPADWLIAQWSTWKESEQLAYFTTLWSVQTTLAALVYPIVIAFVTVFLQRRPAAEAFVHLYVLDSGALVAGLSSLALVVVMAVQYVLLPTHGTSALPIWVALDAVWFLLNASLTTFFLYRTIEFLRPEVQLNVVRRYTVNVAFPRDVARLYAFQLLAQAQTKGWIPAPGYVDDKTPDGPKVLLSAFGFRDGKVQGTFTLREPSRLHNVRLWPLRLVVTSWVRAARRWPHSEGTKTLRTADWPLLTIPITPGNEYQDSVPVTLARVDAGPALHAWQTVLLRWALVFKPLRYERYGIRVKAILSEFETDAREAASRGDVPTFERAYEALVGLHALLLGASLVELEDGSVGSWALLPDTNSIFERALYIGWTNIYRSIFLAAIDAMQQETRPLRRLCHLVSHMNGPELQASPVDVRENALLLPPLMMYQLGAWWTHRVEEQGIMDHGHHHMTILRPPLHRVYDEVLSEFVSGWESARSAIARIPDASQEIDWLLVPTIVRLNTTHIKETARMLLAAVVRGDRAAAEWLADILTKWWGSLGYDRQPFALHDKTDFLTVEHIKLSWPQLCDAFALSEMDTQRSGGKPDVLQRCVLVAALRNFWTDIRLLTLEVLLSWASQDMSASLDESLAMEVSVGLLTGKQWKGGGTLSGALSNISAADYLAAKVRQYAADGEYRGGYIGYLSGFVERIREMQRPSMVSSRVYSFSGADDVASLQEFQLVLLAVLSASDWTINPSLRRQVDIWMSKQYESIHVLRQRLGDWIRRLDNPEDLQSAVVSALLTRTHKDHGATTGRERAKRGIESLRDYLETRRADTLAAEAVDQDRLNQLSMFASSKAFSTKSGAFPLQLFSIVDFSAGDLEDFTLTMNQVRKGELTHVEMEQRAGNESEFWAETMARNVGALALSDVLRACKVRDVHTPDAESYWSALKKEAARLTVEGRHPVLILDNATRPEWVWQWQHADFGEQYPRPDDLRVQRVDGRGDEYVCDFNDIEVYVGPLPAGQSMLLAREVFQRLTFKEFERGRFVDASAVERSDSKLLLDLVLRVSRRVDVGRGDAVQLVYTGGEACELNPASEQFGS